MNNWNDHINSDPNILFGKPTIKGTRIPVEIIIEKLANNYSYEDILDAYPRITKLDIQACLQYAANSLKNEVIYSLAS